MEIEQAIFGAGLLASGGALGYSIALRQLIPELQKQARNSIILMGIVAGTANERLGIAEANKFMLHLALEIRLQLGLRVLFALKNEETISGNEDRDTPKG